MALLIGGLQASPALAESVNAGRPRKGSATVAMSKFNRPFLHFEHNETRYRSVNAYLTMLASRYTYWDTVNASSRSQYHLK